MSVVCLISENGEGDAMTLDLTLTLVSLHLTLTHDFGIVKQTLTFV